MLKVFVSEKTDQTFTKNEKSKQTTDLHTFFGYPDLKNRPNIKKNLQWER